MKVLFLITSASEATWLAEVTHPYWHLAERGIDVDFASPLGGKIVWNPWSDPFTADSQERDDLVSKGFLSDKALTRRLETTLPFRSIKVTDYEAVHVAGGLGAAVDLYPNSDIAEILDYFFEARKVVGAICHGVIALGNNSDRVHGRHVTGYSLSEDLQIEALLGKGFIPNYPQPVLEAAGALFTSAEPQGVRVVIDGNLITGQNQQSASEYGIALHNAIAGQHPVVSSQVR
jgi:putative intracellular protease/amidase